MDLETLGSEAADAETPPDREVGPAPISRRQALRLLAGGLLVAGCTATRKTALPRPGTTVATGRAIGPVVTRPPVPPTTNPPPPPGPVAGFVAFGDSGGGPAQQAVADAMARWAQGGHLVDALVTTGDNVYDFGEPTFFTAQLDKPYRALREGAPGGAQRPLWATLGNHDVMGGHGAAQLAHLGLPPLPYATALSGLRLLFLDGTRPDSAQAAWLDEQLTAPGPTFSAVVFHPPVYSCGLHGPTASVVALWQPILEAHRVSLVLTGHDHLYHRFLSPGGVTYVVTGGGGRPLYDHTPGCGPPELQASSVRHHFTAVEVHADRLVLTAVAWDDEVLDRVEILAAARSLAPTGAPVG